MYYYAHNMRLDYTRCRYLSVTVPASVVHSSKGCSLSKRIDKGVEGGVMDCLFACTKNTNNKDFTS
jgi:hypothetical protein